MKTFLTGLLLFSCFGTSHAFFDGLKKELEKAAQEIIPKGPAGDGIPFDGEIGPLYDGSDIPDFDWSKSVRLTGGEAPMLMDLTLQMTFDDAMQIVCASDLVSNDVEGKQDLCSGLRFFPESDEAWTRKYLYQRMSRGMQGLDGAAIFQFERQPAFRKAVLMGVPVTVGAYFGTDEGQLAHWELSGARSGAYCGSYQGNKYCEYPATLETMFLRCSDTTQCRLILGDVNASLASKYGKPIGDDGYGKTFLKGDLEVALIESPDGTFQIRYRSDKKYFDRVYKDSLAQFRAAILKKNSAKGASGL